jgi:hypothetical protein
MTWIAHEHPRVDRDDQVQRKASVPLLDALYAYCQEKVAGK